MAHDIPGQMVEAFDQGFTFQAQHHHQGHEGVQGDAPPSQIHHLPDVFGDKTGLARGDGDIQVRVAGTARVKGHEIDMVHADLIQVGGHVEGGGFVGGDEEGPGALGQIH